MTFEIADSGFPGDLPGSYKAQLLRTEFVETSFGKGRKWYFLVDVNGEGHEASFLTSMHTGPNSKTYAWLSALLGRSPQAGEKLPDPTGKTVILQLDKNEKGYPKVVALVPHVEPQQVEAGIPR